jgi:predicted dehydrogenase
MIKIAQIGTSRNSHGNDIFNTLKYHRDIFEIVGYCMPENEALKFPEKMADFAGFPELTLEQILNDPTIQAVAVETEEIYLTKYALMAVRAGKHVHMEKPGGTVLADFEKLIAAAKEKGNVLHFGYMYRYNPDIAGLIDRVKRGELGKIISVEAQMNCSHPKEVRQWLKDFPGGMMFFLGCHLIDLILTIQGTPEKIIPLNKCSGIDVTDSMDFGMAVFEYKNGVSFAKASAVELGGFARRQLVVTGSKATVELNPLECYLPGFEYLFTVKTERSSTDWHAAAKPQTSAPHNRYRSMMLSFGQMVQGGKQNPYSLHYELELYKTILKASGK